MASWPILKAERRPALRSVWYCPIAVRDYHVKVSVEVIIWQLATSSQEVIKAERHRDDHVTYVCARDIVNKHPRLDNQNNPR